MSHWEGPCSGFGCGRSGASCFEEPANRSLCGVICAPNMKRHMYRNPSFAIRRGMCINRVSSLSCLLRAWLTKEFVQKILICLLQLTLSCSYGYRRSRLWELQAGPRQINTSLNSGYDAYWLWDLCLSLGFLIRRIWIKQNLLMELVKWDNEQKIPSTVPT